MAVNEIKLGSLKENLDSVEIDNVLVKEGDVVAVDQPIMVVQADKATLEVGAPFAGRIAKLLVKRGDTVKVGQVYCHLEPSNGVAASPTNTKAASPATPSPAPAVTATAPPPKPPTAPKLVHPTASPKPANLTPTGKLPLAGPSTRRLARELGLDLTQVPGSGRSGRITKDDIQSYVRQLAAGVGTGHSAAGQTIATPALPNFEKWGAIEPQPLDGMRKATAKQMSLAWSLIPHVTQHDLVDLTDLEAFRKSQEGKGGVKVTVTAFALKAASIALAQFPRFNASLDTAQNQLVLKKYYHIGVAVDTEYGLIVPVLRDVDKKSVIQIAQELTDIAERGRQRKVTGDEMKGGTFTITNLGGIGGTGFTPIVNWPEVAILGLSRSRLQPVIHEGQIVPRLMLPLSLSYDHRVIDGAAAARFTRRIAELLENPLQMVLHA